MATTIRLTRMGRKKRPFYRLVVLDSRKRRDGAYLANLGFYNPFTEPHEINIHPDEIIEWLSKGATMSDTARSLLRTEGVLYKYSLVKQGMDAAEIETRVNEWRASAEANKAKRDEAKAARVAEAAATAKAAVEAEEKAEAEAKAAAEAEEKAKAAAEAAEAAEAAKAAEAEAAAEAAEAEVEEAPAEEAAVEETPAEEAPAEEKPAEEKPAEEAVEPEATEAEAKVEKKEEDK